MLLRSTVLEGSYQLSGQMKDLRGLMDSESSYVLNLLRKP